ncbi:hypothetical protein C8Q80DRAFT_1344547 [Daedaleopsis nitida]|nr:hypothetical protein C8Q80DRAFT_1344547 [Daedaleopsis nitida]
MAYSRHFHLIRRWVLAICALLSLVWCALLCVEIYLLEDRSDRAQKNLVLVMIFVDAATCAMSIALILVKFHGYVDGARLALLLTGHIGTAALFTLFNPTFVCPTQLSERKVCKDVNLAILVCNWVLPALLVWYSAYFAVTHFRGQDEPAAITTSRTRSREKHESNLLPMMAAPKESFSRAPSTIPSMYTSVTAPWPEPPSAVPPPVPRLPPPILQLQQAPRQPSWRQYPQPPPLLLVQPPMRQPIQAHSPYASHPSPVHLAYLSSSQPSSQHSSQPSSKHSSHMSSRISASSSKHLSLSIPSAYSSSQVGSNDSRRATLQLSRPVPSPVTLTPQSSSPSTSRILSASAPLSLTPIDEDDNPSPHSSRRSSGRLSKPAPPLY